jgi:hypothetical protein
MHAFMWNMIIHYMLDVAHTLGQVRDKVLHPMLILFPMGKAKNLVQSIQKKS